MRTLTYLKGILAVSVVGFLIAVIVLKISILLFFALLVICALVWIISEFTYKGIPIEVYELQVGTEVKILTETNISGKHAIYTIMVPDAKGYPKVLALRHRNNLNIGSTYTVLDSLNGDAVYTYLG